MTCDCSYAILQCVASHPDTKMLFLNGNTTSDLDMLDFDVVVSTCILGMILCHIVSCSMCLQ